MALNSNNLNSAFALGKDKKTGQWKLGQWTNQALWTVDGSNKRICSVKEMTHWRYFREAVEHVSDVELNPGDRVGVTVKRGINEWYYVISTLPSNDGKFNYLVGI